MKSPSFRIHLRDALLLRIAVWCLAAATLAILLVVPLAGVWGVRPIIIDGGSMAPSIARGDVLIVGNTAGPLDPGDLAVVGSGPESYVHRVVESRADSLLLKGDANAEPDLGRVNTSEITGRVLGHIGGPLAIVTAAALSAEGRIGLSLAAITLVSVATVVLRPRSRRPRNGPPDSHAP